MAQNTETQNIKGQVLDDASKSPIAGAVISLPDATHPISTQTDAKGFFMLSAVPIGRLSILVTHIGYEEQVVNEILVTTGKETILSISLTEKISTLQEVSIKASGRQHSNNEMAIVSNRSFNPEDTRKFAGSLGDPSRMIASSAGVASGNDSRNDIVVRGNSPTGLLWQMEGIDIPNPNHYGSLSSTGGPISILNNNNLGKSDFFTGAFPAQYGNAIASVFDLRLRNGNTDKNEFLGEISFTGFELGAEGPLSKKSKSSYLINYRYSTVGILNSLGLNVGTSSAIPKYQDINFKIFIPVSDKSKLSIFGLGGPSNINFLGNDVDTSKNVNLYSGENENLYTRYFKGIAGITYETNFNTKTYGKLTVAFSNSTEKVKSDSISIITRQAYPNSDTRYINNKISLTYNVLHKINAKNSLATGANASMYMFSLFNKQIYGGGVFEITHIDQKSNSFLVQAYSQWKHRFTEKLSVTAGLHFQTLTLNSTSALEPRVGLKYKVNNKGTFTYGYGLQSQMQSLLVYFNRTNIGNQVYYSNKNLGFTKSNHLVAGYAYNISNALHLKTEIYYQHISNVPVDTRPSGFSMLNEGNNFTTLNKDSLLNNGTGSNIGFELTLEKYFSHGSYFLITASIFDSKYKGSDGILRNTAFNSKYVFNVLAGKEFKIGKNRNNLSLNIKAGMVGGKYTSPVNIAASKNENYTIYDETIAPYSLKQDAYFRADFKAGYRVNYKKSTMELGIDLENITNHQNLFMQTYNKRSQTIVSQYQQGFLPVPYFRFTF
jgi:hypothetical protein